MTSLHQLLDQQYCVNGAPRQRLDVIAKIFATRFT